MQRLSLNPILLVCLAGWSTSLTAHAQAQPGEPRPVEPGATPEVMPPPPQTADPIVRELLVPADGLLDLGDGVVIDLNPPPPPVVEVVFVLDTTGSMGGLIDGAKQKIWTIANAIVSAEPRPTVRMGLVGYRDRGDAYVTTRTALTDDIDAVYADLMAYTADGGGDGPESVNQALHEAVHEFAWTPRDSVGDVLRVVYLVGDAPPHMDYEQDSPYAASCAGAAARGIIVNAIQCGSDAETTRVWQEVARLGEGEYFAIEQSGGVQAIVTPFDAELAETSAQLTATIVPFGEASRQVAAEAYRERSGELAEASSAPAAADRAVYMLGAEKSVFGGGRDLVQAIDDGSVDLDALPEEHLPQAMRGMSPEQRRALIDGQRALRVHAQARIGALSAQRAQFLAEAQAAAPEAAGFDAKVIESLRRQVSAAGMTIPQQEERSR